MPLLYNEVEHDRALRQHDRRYTEMERTRDTVGRDTLEYRRAHEDVVIAARLVRVAARRPKEWIDPSSRTQSTETP